MMALDVWTFIHIYNMNNVITNCYVSSRGREPAVGFFFLPSCCYFSSPAPVFSLGVSKMIGFHLCSTVMLLIGSLRFWASQSSFGALNKKGAHLRGSLSHFSLLLACLGNVVAMSKSIRKGMWWEVEEDIFIYIRMLLFRDTGIISRVGHRFHYKKSDSNADFFLFDSSSYRFSIPIL